MGPGSAVGLLLLCGLGGGARVLHSMRYLSIAVSDPSPGVPRFQAMGYVDRNLFVHCSSESKRCQPRTQWIEDNVGQEYWDRVNLIAQTIQQLSYDGLNTLRDLYNQSGGDHTLQCMSGCDLLDDGSTKGYTKVAYDGKDFIAFDKDTMTFIPAVPEAEIAKRKWEQDGRGDEDWNNYLENSCVEWLKKYLSYGRLELERRVSPTVRVSGKEQEDGILTLTCRAHGFYPRPIVLSWLKDGEVRDQDTQWGGLAPNSDGTYYTWASIEAHPGDKDRFRCRVEHASLLQPGLYALEPHSDLLSILLPVAAVVLVAITIIGVLLWKLRAGKNRDGNSATPGMAMGSASSAPGTSWHQGVRMGWPQLLHGASMGCRGIPSPPPELCGHREVALGVSSSPPCRASYLTPAWAG
ncbi:class I histocompatibility antigen, F10 alpha chain-like isoform X3 [Melopsittacus undulatus]|uniref:class I histocompatibility antigen, F10 alpha chain-like isoform X3 n=1 Tax=Melopsittacus undulatus TaxID=13146 RepID=UPI001469F7CF|nr:class I histocompatibility antigen, F10 alpha chain-like isoform X3 [Melopsittacus undulatus]